MPSLLVFEDLDVLCRAEGEGPEAPGAAADPALVAWLCDVLDYLATPSPEWGALPSFLLPAGANGTAAAAAHGGGAGGGGSGSEVKGGGNGSPAAGSGGPAAPRLLWPPVAVAATCRDPAALAAPLRAAGRLDRALALPAPSAESRAAILAAGVRARGAAAAAQDLQAVAEKADGFDAADLEVLLDRALHLALRRRLTAPPPEPQPAAAGPSPGSQQLAASRGPPTELTAADLEGALEGMTPAAFWGVHTQKAVQQVGQGPRGAQDRQRGAGCVRSAHAAMQCLVPCCTGRLASRLQEGFSGCQAGQSWGIHCMHMCCAAGRVGVGGRGRHGGRSCSAV